MAFQVRDDELGLWGAESELGKAVGSDLRRNKRSLPILYALFMDHPIAGRLARALVAGVADEEAARELAAAMEAAGVRAYCAQVAQARLKRAQAELESVPLREGPAADLRLLANYLVERKE